MLICDIKINLSVICSSVNPAVERANNINEMLLNY